LFYHIGNQINWFNFDTLHFLKVLQKFLCRLISIKNLGKLYFVFDGMDTSMKLETLIERASDRVSSLNVYYQKIMSPNNRDSDRYFKPSSLCSTPLIRMTYAQFLFDASKYFPQLKVKFSYLEADAYLAKLASQYNGYVISNDSDFYIYDIPGYVKLDTLKFKENKDNFYFEAGLYTNNLFTKYLGLPKEALPILATLSGNDYIKIGRYKELSVLLKNYKCTNAIAKNIKNTKYKRIVNLILDVCKNLDKEEMKTKKAEEIQNLIIDGIFEVKEKESSKELDDECRKKFKDSMDEYNLVDFKENTEKAVSDELLNSYYSGNIYETLLNVIVINHFKCTIYFDNPNLDSCWHISNDMRKKLYELLLIRNHKYPKEEKSKSKAKKNAKTKAKTNQEGKEEKEGKEGKEGNSHEIHYTITEYRKQDKKVVGKPIEISMNRRVQIPKPLEERMSIYLKNFFSNNKRMRSLPYYLVPLATTLRYYLITKIKSFSYINDSRNERLNCIFKSVTSNMKLHQESTEKNNQGKENKKSKAEDTPLEPKKEAYLHSYEFEALLASSIGALTFTFLHLNNNINSSNKEKGKGQEKEKQKGKDQDKGKNEDKEQKEGNNEKISKSTSSEAATTATPTSPISPISPSSPTKLTKSDFTITDNIEKNNNVDGHNIFVMLKRHRNRCLILKKPWTVGDIRRNREEYDNGIHIYAEFINILLMNSFFLQVLKLTDDIEEFSSLFTMHHYLWEESFYFFCESFKASSPINFQTTFTSLFNINESKPVAEEYINYLEKVYTNIFNTVTIC